MPKGRMGLLKDAALAGKARGIGIATQAVEAGVPPREAVAGRPGDLPGRDNGDQGATRRAAARVRAAVMGDDDMELYDALAELSAMRGSK